ncbi:integrase core domain-containing protein [Xanthomonas oryzae]|uniref:integrase core domain-containing protein n=1 Tax=Xanthomonas oryzae TaxID=347 RepID=UPI0025B739E8|nr:integrase core domain-containing protein [Xanthomonas oryzae]
MPSAQVLDRHAGLGFAQEADDLLFGKALLHVQSPRGRELDSKLRCYSKSGGASLPQQNGMVEQVIRTLKEQCVHRHRLESQTHALRVIADWIAFYNPQRPHQALKMMTPNAAYAATLTA